MKTQNIEKRDYISPVIEQIKLDNEISLALESTPPVGPNEVYMKAPDALKNDPFRSELG